MLKFPMFSCFRICYDLQLYNKMNAFMTKVLVRNQWDWGWVPQTEEGNQKALRNRLLIRKYQQPYLLHSKRSHRRKMYSTVKVAVGQITHTKHMKWISGKEGVNILSNAKVYQASVELPAAMAPKWYSMFLLYSIPGFVTSNFRLTHCSSDSKT